MTSLAETDGERVRFEWTAFFGKGGLVKPKSKTIKVMREFGAPWLMYRPPSGGVRISYQPAEILEVDSEIGDWLVEMGWGKPYRGDELPICPEFFEGVAPPALKREGWQQRAWNKFFGGIRK